MTSYMRERGKKEKTAFLHLPVGYAHRGQGVAAEKFCSFPGPLSFPRPAHFLLHSGSEGWGSEGWGKQVCTLILKSHD